MPLWAQLAFDLRRRLASGEFASGFPTDRELTEAYHVSRNTAREAVRHLGSQGLLDRQRGRGTTVRHVELGQHIGTLYSLRGSVERQGMEQRSQVRALGVRTDQQAAAQLGLADDCHLIYVERLRLANDSPLALDKVWLPSDVAKPLLRADLSHAAAFDRLAELCGVEVVSSDERIRPTVPTGQEQVLLAIPPGTAAFSLERTVRASQGPVEYGRSLVRGDRFSLVARWSSLEAPKEPH